MNPITHYLSAIKQNCMEIADRDSFLYAIKRIKRKKCDGEYYLARIYETGSSIVQRDLACAYALYYIAAERGMEAAREHLNQLALSLMADDLQRAQHTIEKLKNEQYH